MDYLELYKSLTKHEQIEVLSWFKKNNHPTEAELKYALDRVVGMRNPNLVVEEDLF